MTDCKLTIRISNELLSKLQKMADDDDRTLSAFCRLRLEDVVMDNVTTDEIKFLEKVNKIKNIASKI